MSKIGFKELARTLVAKYGLEQRAAEQFVEDMFGVLATGIETDRQVKVKGLGTFKVVGVAARKSVDVNTGEPIVIEGRDKVTFTPDSAMRELVNRPFSQFETVVVNEGVDFSTIDAQFAEGAEGAEGVESAAAGQLAADDEEPAAPAPADVPADEAPLAGAAQAADSGVVVADEAGTDEAPVVLPDDEATNESKTDNLTENEPIMDYDTNDTHVIDDNVEPAVEAPAEPAVETPAEPAVEPPAAPAVETPAEPVEEAPAAPTDANDAAPETEPQPTAEQTMLEAERIADDARNQVILMQQEMMRHNRFMRLFLGVASLLLVACVAGIFYMAAQITQRDHRIEHLEAAAILASNTPQGRAILDASVDTAAVARARKDSIEAAHRLSEEESARQQQEKAVSQQQSQTLATAAKDEKKSEANAQPKSEPKNSTASNASGNARKDDKAKTATAAAAQTDNDKLQAKYNKDVRIRTGAYVIVGIERTVTAKAGQTLAGISRTNLGPGMECYIEAVNDAHAQLKAGDKVNIPKLKLKKKK